MAINLLAELRRTSSPELPKKPIKNNEVPSPPQEELAAFDAISPAGQSDFDTHDLMLEQLIMLEKENLLARYDHRPAAQVPQLLGPGTAGLPLSREKASIVLQALKREHREFLKWKISIAQSSPDSRRASQPPRPWNALLQAMSEYADSLNHPWPFNRIVRVLKEAAARNNYFNNPTGFIREAQLVHLSQTNQAIILSNDLHTLEMMRLLGSKDTAFAAGRVLNQIAASTFQRFVYDLQGELAHFSLRHRRCTKNDNCHVDPARLKPCVEPVYEAVVLGCMVFQRWPKPKISDFGVRVFAFQTPWQTVAAVRENERIWLQEFVSFAAIDGSSFCDIGDTFPTFGWYYLKSLAQIEEECRGYDLGGEVDWDEIFGGTNGSWRGAIYRHHENRL
ncbi:hypothetical protein VFPPC_04679 [Pochonia chlamydosporia 170]|uniref:Uncharacterized protein n=1 Tax=Pochonia chlamydosporia 170 TaxID=1380566 RepID=A0A179FTI1_METCM|nr:hypothetical protein VFPPC_04679 [Pochonia chlamydosporia 170]OAQ68441.1 hypothetical protein VFPPC_04679 [Pochonia chlamydosporia 170]